jgi:hypothetical protein
MKSPRASNPIALPARVTREEDVESEPAERFRGAGASPRFLNSEDYTHGTIDLNISFPSQRDGDREMKARGDVEVRKEEEGGGRRGSSRFQRSR